MEHLLLYQFGDFKSLNSWKTIQDTKTGKDMESGLVAADVGELPGCP